MVAGVPVMCISTSGALASAATPSRSGSWRPALTSLTMVAPAARAAAATAALRVSIETATSAVRARSPTTGQSRRGPRRLGGVDRGGHLGGPGQLLDHRQDPLQLDRLGHVGGPGPGRLATDVEQVGALGDQGQPMGPR